MNAQRARLVALAVAVLLPGCQKLPGSSSSEASATTTTSSSTTGTAATSSTSMTTGTTSMVTMTSTTEPETETETETEGCLFLGCGDTPRDDNECDPWLQDCPEGEKCMPWANDGGSAWNALKCSPIDPAPVGPGELCTAEESGVSGVDNCDAHSMCWDVDPETLEGACLPFCMGTSPEDATCGAGFYCSLVADGVLILCQPFCDPLSQDCPNDDLCIPHGEIFICALDASGEAGFYGDPCEYANACGAGLYCLNPEYVEGCQSAGCCTPFCDTTKPPMCPGATQECIPWYEEGMAPPQYENVGICGIPQ